MNKLIIIGNLTKAPESGKTSSGVQYCKFTVAVNRDYKDSEGNKVTDFISVTVWRQLADLCFKYLTKGNKVCVEGQLQTRVYENKNGEKVYTFDVIADSVDFLTAKPKTDDK